MADEQFRSVIKARASVLHDPVGSVLRILPPPKSDEVATMDTLHSEAITSPTPSTTSVEEEHLLPARVAKNTRAKVAKERMKKIPRPPNAFILYRQHHHPKVKAAHPDMHNNEICKYSTPS